MTLALQTLWSWVKMRIKPQSLMSVSVWNCLYFC